MSFLYAFLYLLGNVTAHRENFHTVVHKSMAVLPDKNTFALFIAFITAILIFECYRASNPNFQKIR